MLPKLADPLGLEKLRHDAGHDPTVFQRVSQPLGLPRPVRQHPPRAVGSAQHVGGVEHQMTVPPTGVYGAARAEKGRVAIDEVGWDQSFGHQPSGTIKIRQNQFHQLGALAEARFDR